MNTYIKRQIQNLAIFLLVVIGFGNLFSALPLKFAKNFENFYTKLIGPDIFIMRGAFSFILGVLLLLLAHSLYRRARIAWIIEIIVLTATLMLQIIHFHKLTIPIVSIDFFVLIILVCSYKDFCRLSDRLTLKLAFIFIGISFLLLIINAAVGLNILRTSFKNMDNFLDAIISSVQLLIFMDTSVIETTSKLGAIYVNSLIWVNWICIIFSVLFLLKPLVYNRVEDKYDKERVRKIVLKYGQNPMSYLSLENDKKYFFSNNIDGVCSYTVVGNILVVCGDIICSHEDGFLFLMELMGFCKQNGWNILMLNVTEYFLDLYREAKFGIVKYGEDACFDLSEYNLIGGKVAKVRAAINHANKAGITVSEYNPNKNRNHEIECQINDISNEWLKGKNGVEMSFMLGGVNIDKPMDRRYFYARDNEGKILGFVVFSPYLSGKGYLADVTRRRKDAPQGVLEKIVYDAFMIMKEEGVQWGNMGLCPLHNVAEGDKTALTEKLFAYVYDNMNNSYGFKALHHAKEKYSPTKWETRYLVYSSKPFSPQYAYAIVKAQNPKGISKLLISQFEKKRDNTDEK